MADLKLERILEAGEALILAHGLRATTMEAVAREAGVAKPTLYARFADKEALFRAIVARVNDALRVRFEAALEGDAPVEDRIAGALAAKYEGIAEVVGGSPHAAEILEANATVAGAEHAAIHDWTRDLIASLLAEAGRADPDRLAALVTAAVSGLYHSAPLASSQSEDVAFVARRLLAPETSD